MTELNKVTTSYTISVNDGDLSATGQANVRADNTIESMYLSVQDAGREIGQVNFSQFDGGANMSYNTGVEARMQSVSTLANKIISEVKQKLAAV